MPPLRAGTPPPVYPHPPGLPYFQADPSPRRQTGLAGWSKPAAPSSVPLPFVFPGKTEGFYVRHLFPSALAPRPTGGAAAPEASVGPADQNLRLKKRRFGQFAAVKSGRSQPLRGCDAGTESGSIIQGNLLQTDPLPPPAALNPDGRAAWREKHNRWLSGNERNHQSGLGSTSDTGAGAGGWKQTHARHGSADRTHVHISADQFPL